MARASTIMIVDLSVDPAKQPQFDSFYHDYYIPEFLKALPEIITARRYAQTDILGKVDAAKAHFLTIYELDSDNCMDALEAGITKSADKDAFAQFKQWKQDAFTYFDRAFYSEVYRHPRQPENKSWGTNSLYAFQWTLKPDVSSAEEKQFADEYLNLLMENVPTWIACRTYLRQNSEPNSFLTIFETADQESLLKSVETGNEALPEAELTALSNWAEKALDQHNSLSLEPIYFHSAKKPS